MHRNSEPTWLMPWKKSMKHGEPALVIALWLGWPYLLFGFLCQIGAMHDLDNHYLPILHGKRPYSTSKAPCCQVMVMTNKHFCMRCFVRPMTLTACKRCCWMEVFIFKDVPEAGHHTILSTNNLIQNKVLPCKCYVALNLSHIQYIGSYSSWSGHYWVLSGLDHYAPLSSMTL